MQSRVLFFLSKRPGARKHSQAGRRCRRNPAILPNRVTPDLEKLSSTRGALPLGSRAREFALPLCLLLVTVCFVAKPLMITGRVQMLTSFNVESQDSPTAS